MRYAERRMEDIPRVGPRAIAPPTSEKDSDLQRRTSRLGLPVALAAAGVAGDPAAIGSADARRPPSPDVVVMAKLQPLSVATATAVAARNDLTLRTTIPDIGWACRSCAHGSANAARTRQLVGEPAGWRSATAGLPAISP